MPFSLNAKSALPAALVALCGLVPSAQAAPVTYDGILFPEGNVSFADVIVSYTPGGGFSGSPSAFCQDSTRALGAPNYVSGTCNGYVSLGDSGVLIVQFTNNALTASGTADADLHIFEIGAQVEDMFIAISEDGTNWIDFGELDGQPTSIDIDASPSVSLGTQYSFVRIIDGNENLSGSVYAGADIDAIGAISTTVVPLPAGVWLGISPSR